MQHYFEIKIKDKRVCGLLPMSKRKSLEWIKSTYKKYELIKFSEKVER